MSSELQSVRVLDLASSPAGRLPGDYLESRGATVLRLSLASTKDDAGGLVVDAAHADGHQLLRDLVAVVDVLIVDAASRPLEPNPGREGLIVLDLSPFGPTGPWADYLTTDVSVAAAAGLSDLTGPADGPPTPLPEVAGPAGELAALALVAALDDHRRTGGGRRIDVSELDATLEGLWTAVLDWTVNGREQQRLGARDGETAPHGVYRCRDGNWLSIACFTDEEWFGLKVALGRPDWCELERMQTRASRVQEQREIDHHIGHWINEQTRRTDEPPVLVITMMDNLEVPRYTSHEMAEYFQKFGVPAAVVERPASRDETGGEQPAVADVLDALLAAPGRAASLQQQGVLRRT